MARMMQTAVMPEPGRLEIRDVPVPALGDEQVLIKVEACAICTWEQRMYRGADRDAYPFRGGHEMAGIVVDKGARSRCEAEPGDRVAVAAIVRCGACYFCRRGLDNLCENDVDQRSPGEVWGPGGLSEFLVAEDYNVYKAAGAPEVEALALAEPVACVVRSVEKARLVSGDTALIQGAGVMGLLHLVLLERQGVQALVAEPDPARAEMALSLGAVAVCNPLDGGLPAFVRSHTRGRGAEAAFFTAGGPAAVEEAVGTLVKGGHLVLYGSIHPKGPISLDPNKIHYDELTVTGIFTHSKQSFQRAVRLISKGIVDLGPFISARVPFPHVDEAFRRAAGNDTYRVVVTFGG